jgi:hypothetical protein
MLRVPSRRRNGEPESGAAAFSEDQEPTREECHGSTEKTRVDLRRPAALAVLVFIPLAVVGESRHGGDQRQRENRYRQ